MKAIDLLACRFGRALAGVVAACMATLCLLAPAHAGETITFFHNDNAGSPALASDVNGNPVWKETYRPYGDRLVDASTSGNNALWFAGKPYDEQTGLSYMGARYYDPAVGRFMSVDPAQLDLDQLQTINRYAYANNNPYKFVDEDGHSPVDVAFLVYDLGKLSVALWTGTGVAAAAMDVAWSAVGVASPIPGTGQVIKAARAADRAVDVVKAADLAGDAVAITKLGDKVSHAAKGVKRGGESAAAAAGRRAHGNYGTALGDKYDTRVTLPSGKKPDAVSWEAREVRELKPDNPAAVRRGQRQVEEYRKELEDISGESWTSKIDVYRGRRH